ncbi:DUF5955 family protein [Streptomyces sp. NRRL F-5126]|uniref:DUF5955 family protein n=1 Tax=Streptomyces sp. NRRL F-5126 TaxID=1463857 RepID=UPI000B018B4C|nr:DUF5955 family protein [Streptomyces sp. NRRL F-5126]
MLGNVGRMRVADEWRPDEGLPGETAVAAAGGGTGHADARVAALCAAVARLRRELAAYPGEFRDRGVAEEELAALAATVEGGAPELVRMRRSLLLIVGSIGSVSALVPALMAVRTGVEVFAPDPVGRPRD